MGVENLKKAFEDKNKEIEINSEKEQKIIEAIREIFDLAYKDFISGFMSISDSNIDSILSENIEENDNTFVIPIKMRLPFIEMENGKFNTAPALTFIFNKIMYSTDVYRTYMDKVPMENIDYLREEFEILYGDYIDYRAINGLYKSDFEKLKEIIERRLEDYGLQVIKTKKVEYYYSNRTLHLEYAIKVKNPLK